MSVRIASVRETFDDLFAAVISEPLRYPKFAFTKYHPAIQGELIAKLRARMLSKAIKCAFRYTMP